MIHHAALTALPFRCLPLGPLHSLAFWLGLPLHQSGLECRRQQLQQQQQLTKSTRQVTHGDCVSFSAPPPSRPVSKKTDTTHLAPKFFACSTK